MISVYGLKNCDTCRKARKWLDGEGLAHRFLDLRADGVEEERVTRWIAAVGWEVLLNRRGTTWRTLPDGNKHDIDADRALVLMMQHPALIKRPVFEAGDKVLVGFKDDVQAALKEAGGG